MSIGKIYAEVKKDKENEVRESSISMSREDFISEHTNLIRILRSGDKKVQEAEAIKQEKELAEEVGEEETEEDDEGDEEEEED